MPKSKSLWRIWISATLALAVFSCSAPIGTQNTTTATATNARAAGELPQNVGRLTGVNWFGFETGNAVVHGLWTRDYKSVLKQIWDLGFNCVRLPYSDAMLSASPNGIQVNEFGVDAYTKKVGMNTDLAGLTSLQVLDKVIAEATRLGLKIILDNHARKADGYMNETLWYTDTVSEDQWIANWVFIVNRYKNNPLVVAADIDNEPHGNLGQGMKPPAAWGYDVPGYPHTDWKKAAERAGAAILAANPKMLIIVEGVEEHKGETYWWGGNLQGVKTDPITSIPASNLVYSAHEYGSKVYPQKWFSDPAFPNNLPDIWDHNFWFIHKQGIGPLFFGEFGINEVDAADPSSIDYKWLKKFMDYAGLQSSWTFWCMNPNSGDTGGILKGDWVTVETAKYNLIKPYLASQGPGITPSPIPSVSPSPIASPSPVPTPSPSPIPTPSPSPTPPAQTPYNGTPVTIPGTIEAENFDNGGEGVAFHDTDAANNGGAYRTTAVDLEAASGGGYNVGWTASGEWLEYTVNTAVTNAYQFSIRAASLPGARNLHIEVDGVTRASFTVPATGGWQTYTTLNSPSVNLTAGIHVVRLAFDADSINVDKILVAGPVFPTPSPTPTPSPLPSPSPSPIPSPSPSPIVSPSPQPGNIVVTYTKNDWGSGFTGNIVIKNNGTSAVNAWTLKFSFAGNQTINQFWSSTIVQSGKNVTATPLSYNASIPAGGSINFGFNGTYSGSNVDPTNFVVTTN